MRNTLSKAEQALLDRVATMTADEADALASVQATDWRKAQGSADAALFGPAVTLARLTHLGVVADGRAKQGDAVESFGSWGKRHGYTSSATVTLLRRLGMAVGHGITPSADPEAWAAVVQVGTRKAVGDALAAKPGAKNSAAARKAVIAQRDGTAPKTPRKAQTPDGSTRDKGDETHKVTAGNVGAVVIGLRTWFETEGNLSAVKAEDLVAIRAHFADLADMVEAEGHKRIAAKRTPAAPRVRKTA